ncbi:MAG TPA: CDP-diacylglycerol diphosphatase [Rickettsiales bacterium]|nr:CDP-diacylglycerol diphosphatase [Rickettsiales bacterium]
MPATDRSLFSVAYLVVAACALLLSCAGQKEAGDRQILWRIVHDRCVAGQEQHDNPHPCTYVDLQDGYALFKDRVGPAQYLLMPTERVSGIEDPAILGDHAPNYWQAAWDARKYVFRKLGHPLPRDGVGMAVNSSLGRTQDQLHIHIDCMKPEVTGLLAAVKDEIGTAWTRLPVRLQGHEYEAMLLKSGSLKGTNLFALLAAEHPDMGRETLVVTGITLTDGTSGFVLLSHHISPLHADFANGEELLDHSCGLPKK